jgi:hypothetical protein
MRAGPPGPRARPTHLHADSAEGGEEGRKGEQARQVPELDPPTFMLRVRRGGKMRRPARPGPPIFMLILRKGVRRPIRSQSQTHLPSC